MRGLTDEEYASLRDVGDGSLATARNFVDDREVAIVIKLVEHRRVDVFVEEDSDGVEWERYRNSALGDLAVRLWPATRHTEGS